MKKYSLRWLLFMPLLIGLNASGQDYIINWNNDTIRCQLPGNAKDIDLRPRWKYENGYIKIAAIFSKDSLRVIEAGEIKGYTRSKHGKALLCNGFFEAKQIRYPSKRQTGTVPGPANPRKENWSFVSRLVEGKYASLYIAYEFHGSATCAIYYLSWQDPADPHTIIPVYTKRQLARLLSGDDETGSISDFRYRKTRKGFSDIIHEYNRLKELASREMQP